MTSDQGLLADAGARAAAIAAIVAAWERGDPALPALIERVDREVVALLARHGLPRGPIAGIEIQEGIVGWVGRKSPDCEIRFSGDELRAFQQHHKSDDILRTWIHESLHARQPFAPGYGAEYQNWRGYEEGLVESLTLLVAGAVSEGIVANSALAYYVAGWSTLASSLRIDPRRFLLSHWSSAPGTVRRSFIDVIERLMSEMTGDRLEPDKWSSILSIADLVFSSTRTSYTPDEMSLRRLWEAALR